MQVQRSARQLAPKLQNRHPITGLTMTVSVRGLALLVMFLIVRVGKHGPAF
jgi:hypothetical protein